MHYDSIEDLGRRLRDRSLSPVDLVEACSRRIEALNPRLNAFITVIGSARDQARVAEAELRAGRWRGPLHGIPVAVKDFYDTAGIRTTGGYEPFSRRVPERDAAVVKKLKQAGAILVGKTNMDALGMATTGLTSGFGPVRNPWNDACVCGGSSAGSAAAVAAGLCCAAVDTDAIGSVRLPAACCGVVGFKAGYGVISVEGILGDRPVDDFIRWMGHAGITTRSALDAALVLGALASPEGQDFAGPSAEDGRPLRLGVDPEFHPDAQLRPAFDAAVAVLRAAGCELRDAAVPYGDPAHEGMASIERDRAGIAEQAFAQVDVIVLTTLPSAVPSVDEATREPEQGVPAELTAFANYYGLPAISMPCGFDRRGLPIGLQLVGRPGGERAVLRVARLYERATTFGCRHPLP